MYLRDQGVTTTMYSCRQLEHCLSKTVDRRLTEGSTETQHISVYRHLTYSCRQLQKFSGFELFSDWDSKEVSESLLLESVDWMARMVLLKIWKV